jgi:hypothetical protein
LVADKEVVVCPKSTDSPLTIPPTAELINYVNSIPEGERIRLSLVHKCWEMETEIDHAVEDQLESIYDALDSVNIVADVNFYSYLRKLEDPKDMEKKVVTPWTLGKSSRRNTLPSRHVTSRDVMVMWLSCTKLPILWENIELHISYSP